MWIEALENYVVLQTKTKRYTILFTITNIEKIMPKHLFIRVHRSFIVCIKNISTIQDNTVIMNFNKEQKIIPIAKTYRRHLAQKLNIIS